MALGSSMLIAAWLLTTVVVGPPAPKPISIGTADFPPFVIVEGDKIGGVDAEIVRIVFDRLGYRVDMQAYPWSRTYKLAMTGKLPVIFTFTKSPEREKYFYISGPIASVKDVIFKKRDRKLTWAKLEDLKGLTLGVSQGYSYAPEFMQFIASKTVKIDYATGKTPELIHLRKLRRDRIDAFICEASVCSYLIKSYPKEFENIHFINRVVGPVRPFHVGFSKANSGSKKLQQDFDRVLGEMAKSGELDRLHRRYGIVTLGELGL